MPPQTRRWCRTTTHAESRRHSPHTLLSTSPNRRPKTLRSSRSDRGARTQRSPDALYAHIGQITRSYATPIDRLDHCQAGLLRGSRHWQLHSLRSRGQAWYSPRGPDTCTRHVGSTAGDVGRTVWTRADACCWQTASWRWLSPQPYREPCRDTRRFGDETAAFAVKRRWDCRQICTQLRGRGTPNQSPHLSHPIIHPPCLKRVRQPAPPAAQAAPARFATPATIAHPSIQQCQAGGLWRRGGAVAFTTPRAHRGRPRRGPVVAQCPTRSMHAAPLQGAPDHHRLLPAGQVWQRGPCPGVRLASQQRRRPAAAEANGRSLPLFVPPPHVMAAGRQPPGCIRCQGDCPVPDGASMTRESPLRPFKLSRFTTRAGRRPVPAPPPPPRCRHRSRTKPCLQPRQLRVRGAAA